VAGKNRSAALMGLSAVTTNNSGFMFIGMIGATYTMIFATKTPCFINVFLWLV